MNNFGKGIVGASGTIGSVVVAGGGTSGACIMAGLATVGLGSALLGIGAAAGVGYLTILGAEKILSTYKPSESESEFES